MGEVTSAKIYFYYVGSSRNVLSICKSKPGVPDLSLNMHPFSISKDGHVHLKLRYDKKAE